MNLLYLEYDAFIYCMKQKGFEIYNQNDRCIYILSPQGRFHIFQVFHNYVIANYMELQKIFKEDAQQFYAISNKHTQKKRTPHVDGLTYGGVTYHYAFEFKLASIGKTISVVTSNYNNDTEDFSGLCLENGFKVISIKKSRDDAFFEIIQSVVDGYLSVEELYKREHPGEELVQLLRVKDRDFLKKFEKCKKSKESVALNAALNEKMKLYFEGQNIKKIPQETQIDFISYSIASFSLPLICSKIPNVEWVTFFTIFKGGCRFEQRVANKN